MQSKPPKLEVALWWMEVAPSSPSLAEWRTVLDTVELRQAERFHSEHDRADYLAAHWLLRNALASTGIAPAQRCRFIIDKRGKPRIDPEFGRPELQFNLSHTRGLVACALCTTGAIGIDVERLVHKPDLADIAARYFCRSELALVEHAPPHRRTAVFTRLWTLKEAFIKATGEGFHRALDSFSFALDPVAIAFHPVDADDPANWKFVEYRPTSQYRLAIAVRQRRDVSVNVTIRRCNEHNARMQQAGRCAAPVS